MWMQSSLDLSLGAPYEGLRLEGGLASLATGMPCDECLQWVVWVTAHDHAADYDDDPTLTEEEAWEARHNAADKEAEWANSGLAEQLDYLSRDGWNHHDLRLLRQSCANLPDGHIW
jgi:hypothetical protein